MSDQVLTKDRIVAELNELLRTDIDAVGAYETAIAAIPEAEVKRELTNFKADHERHITDLRSIIERNGGKPVVKADFKGMLQKGFTKVAGLVGTEATLRAMLQNEKVTNQMYGKGVQKGFPPDVLEVVQRNYSDEQRHFAWIDNALRQRIWEQAQHPSP
jgi:uncharacterized protein (TIGR02284 family)